MDSFTFKTQTSKRNEEVATSVAHQPPQLFEICDPEREHRHHDRRELHLPAAEDQTRHHQIRWDQRQESCDSTMGDSLSNETICLVSLEPVQVPLHSHRRLLLRSSPLSLTHSLTLFSVSEPIAMGHLSGNHFEIVLREIQSDPSVVEAACEGLSSTGYVNYFGLQRFGRGGAESGSHLIGLEIFQAHWKAALGIMFQPNSSDRSDIHQAKVAYQRGDFSAALKLLPSSMYSEIRVCEKLRSDPHDYAGAYHSIPRSTQLICVHAFQSFIFNLATTQRCAVRILLSVLTPSLPSQD
jgi:hypothetical protein